MWSRIQATTSQNGMWDRSHAKAPSYEDRGHYTLFRLYGVAVEALFGNGFIEAQYGIWLNDLTLAEKFR